MLLVVAGGLFASGRVLGFGPVAPAGAEDPPAADTSVIADFQTHLDRHRLVLAAAKLARIEERRLLRLQAQRRQRLRFSRLPGGVSRGTLESIAACESGGDPRIVSSNGLYHGKYQFSVDTWSSVGGEGLPSAASEAEQDYRAALLYARSGAGQWPVCGS